MEPERPDRLADALYTIGKAHGQLYREDIQTYLLKCGVPHAIIGQVLDGLGFIHRTIREHEDSNGTSSDRHKEDL